MKTFKEKNTGSRELLFDFWQAYSKAKTGDERDKIIEKTVAKINKVITRATRTEKGKLIIWIAEYAYYHANPKSKMDVPSIVYEQVRKDFSKFLETLNSKKL